MSKYELPTDRVFITTDYMRKKYGTYDPNIFKRWTEQGRVEKVKNGLYMVDEFNPIHDVEYFSIANRVYEPSYVSTISALRYWNFIPETVYSITSVSTKKTTEVVFRGTRFSYQQLKPALYFGFEVVKWKGLPYRIAKPAKALLDLAYLEPLFSDPGWLEEMRFDPYEIEENLDWDDMLLFAGRFDSEVVYKRVALLLETYNL
ncbi:MAG: hypothetical protein AAF828_06625 [Bacteroidota bacterium]